MINLKIVLLGFYFPIAMLSMLDFAFPEQLSIGQMILMATIISFIGGLSAAYQDTDSLKKMLKTGFTTATAGFCIGAIATYVAEEPRHAWPIVGLTGILSLAGLAGVDWLIKVGRRRFTSILDRVFGKVEEKCEQTESGKACKIVDGKCVEVKDEEEEN